MRAGPAICLCAAIALQHPAAAETAVAARAIPARQIIAEGDIDAVSSDIAGSASIAEALGRETRVTIHKGQPVLLANLAWPALVERNQTVRLLLATGGLTIEAEGRALARGAAGDTIRILNAGSRSVVTGRIRPDGTVEISIP